jgi:Flp pilus assembly protein TadG
MRRAANGNFADVPGAKRAIRRFRRHATGTIAVIFALAAPAILAVAGVAVDFLFYSVVRTHLQTAADSAATAGAREFSVAGVKDSQVEALVQAFLKNGIDERNGPASFEIKIDRKKSTVAVSVKQDWTPFFAHFLDSGITPVHVGATAALAGTTNVCVLTLDPVRGAALHLDMIARLEANDCATYSDSTNIRGIQVDALATVEADLICSAGGVLGLLTKMTPAPTTDCPVLPDPLEKRQPPAAGSCDHNKLVIKNAAKTLHPGTYCGGIAITGKSNVRFSPGIYVIKDGPFTVANKSAIDGTDVGFYLTGDKAMIDFSGNTTISLSGAEKGTMAGLLFFEDRGAKLDRVHRIKSANAHELTGTIYLPRGKLFIDPNTPVAADSAYTAIVARQLELTQGPTLVLNSDYGATSVPVPDGIKVTGTVVLTR